MIKEKILRKHTDAFACFCTPSRPFWSFLPAERGRKLIVCLFTQTVAISPPELRAVFTSLPLPLSQVDSDCKRCWSGQSVSQLCVLWSSGLTPLHLLVPCVVLFQLWSNLIHAERKWPWLSICRCRSSVKLHMVCILYIWSRPYGEQIGCFVGSVQTGSICVSIWGSVQLT